MTKLQTPLQRAKWIADSVESCIRLASNSPKDSLDFWFAYGSLVIAADSLANAVKQLTEEDAS